MVARAICDETSLSQERTEKGRGPVRGVLPQWEPISRGGYAVAVRSRYGDKGGSFLKSGSTAQHCHVLRAMTQEDKDEDAGGQGAAGATGRGPGIQKQPGEEGATCCPRMSSRALLSQPEAGANAIPKGSPVPSPPRCHCHIRP